MIYCAENRVEQVAPDSGSLTLEFRDSSVAVDSRFLGNNGNCKGDASRKATSFPRKRESIASFQTFEPRNSSLRCASIGERSC